MHTWTRNSYFNSPKHENTNRICGPDLSHLVVRVACRYSHAGLGAGVSAVEAQQWAAQFAAGSYGDALPACALALLLRRDVPRHVQARHAMSYLIFMSHLC